VYSVYKIYDKWEVLTDFQTTWAVEKGLFDEFSEMEIFPEVCRVEP